MNREELNSRLKTLSEGKVSKWESDAINREINNNEEKKTSELIALKILRILRHRNMSQAALASKLNVSPQQVSKWLKGKENLTVETIDKISNALSVNLISVPTLNVSQVFMCVDSGSLEFNMIDYKSEFSRINLKLLNYIETARRTSKKSVNYDTCNKWSSQKNYAYLT